MATCGQLTAGIAVDCTNPLVAGAKDRLILFNFDDKESPTKNISNPLIIEDLILASGKVAYEFDGKNGSIEPSVTLLVKDFAEVYEHGIVAKVFSNSPDSKKQLESLAKGRVVAIVENNHTGSSGNAAFEVYGFDSGLTLQVLTRTVTDDATQGAWQLELKTHAKSPEAHVPYTFFITDYATTKAIIDALL